jgi:hypothetical protein
MLRGGFIVLIFWLVVLNVVQWGYYLTLVEYQPNWPLILGGGVMGMFSALIYGMFKE